MSEKIFAKGMRYELPHQSAPTWVRGKISVKVAEFIEFLEQHQNDKGWVNLDVLESKGGNWYIQLNTYQKEKRTEEAPPVIEDNYAKEV